MPGVNAAMIEFFENDDGSLKELKKCVDHGKITQAHSHNCDNITNSLSLFLMYAQERSYY